MSTGSRSHEAAAIAAACFPMGRSCASWRDRRARPAGVAPSARLGKLQEWARNVATAERCGEAFWDGPNSAKLST
jgi:hypothetical protein